MHRLFRLALGSLLLLIGLVGLVLPFIQGWLFLALGMICLSPYVPQFARMEGWISDRFPAIGVRIKRLKRVIMKEPA